MGKPTGFLEYKRVNNGELKVEERISNFNGFIIPLKEEKVKEQASRCMNCGIPFCQSAMKYNNRFVGCPLSNLIPEWNHLLYLGLYQEAYKRLIKTSPFPEFTSRVCPALCEACCSCSINDDSVTVKSNELFIIENAFKNGYVKVNNDIVRNNKKVAIIGSGPSGLAAAKTLNDAGYTITVYEKNDRFGGLLMYGIPNMKIEKSIIDRRINLLKEEGITFINNTYVGKDISVEKLTNDYDHILFSCGTSKARELNVENSKIDGVVYAVDFLTDTTKSVLDNKSFKYDVENKNVVIIGGGDTGNDCVASSVRMKAKSITMLEITKEPSETNTLPWPNYPNKKKTDYGIKEANTIYNKEIRLYQTTIDSVVGNDKISGIYIKKVDEKFKEIPNSKKYLPCDLLIVSMGFVGTSKEDLDLYNLESNNYMVKLDGFKYNDKISVCGDMKNGQSLVVRAIKDGIDAAKYIMGKI